MLHLVVSIPPKIAVARFVGQIKGVAATRFNQLNLAGKSLFWQDEYGVFSFDGKRLPNYIAYVERQKEHHAECSILLPLERLGGESPARIHEEAAEYWLELEAWRNEFAS
ncbi:MAG: transposase [Chloroflexota bacterium]